MEEFFHCVFSSIVGGQTNFSDRIKSTVYISVLTIFVDNSYYIGGENDLAKSFKQCMNIQIDFAVGIFYFARYWEKYVRQWGHLNR